MDNAIVRLCAAACEESYDDAASGFITVGDLRYGVRESAELVVAIVAIRGTANADNALSDISFWPRKSPTGSRCHGGFLRCFHELCDGGLVADTARYRPSRIIATGHSLGGAIATLLAEQIGCRLITFGSPRVYSRFGSLPEIDHTRIVCDDDPVPGLPRIFFRHTCEPIVLRDDDHRLIEVKDHYMANYRARLETSNV